MSDSSIFTESSEIAPQLDALVNGAEGSEETEEQQELSPEQILEKKALEESKPDNEEQEKEEKPLEDSLSKKFAALSRREKAIRTKEKELERRLKDLESKVQSSQSEPQKQQNAEPEISIEELIRRNPMKALEKYGWNMNKLAENVLNDGKLPMEMQMQLMRDEIKKELMSETESLRKQLQEKEEAERIAKDQRIIEDFKNEINDHVAQNSEKYELIVATGNEELIYDTIQEYHNTHGEVMPYEEAAELVEAHLEEQARGVFEKTKKARNFLQPPAQAKPQPQPSKANSPTLTNQASGTIPSSEKPFLSDEESLAQAAKLIRWSE